MASNLECVGLDVGREGFGELVGTALADAVPLGEHADARVLAWQDPSGVRLVLTVQGSSVVDLLPSFAGAPGARLVGVRAVNEDVAFADVVDDDGDLVTRLALELEQRRWLAHGEGASDGGDAGWSGPASIVAFGVAVDVFEDEAAFEVADASLLNPPGRSEQPDDDVPGEASPDGEVTSGTTQPPRLAAESFISFGVFAPDAEAEAYARLAGIVLRAERRRVEATGQSIVVVRVRTVGMEIDLCLPGDAGAPEEPADVGAPGAWPEPEPGSPGAPGDTDASPGPAPTPIPEPGNVVSGVVFLVGSAPGLVPTPGRPGPAG